MNNLAEWDFVPELDDDLVPEQNRKPQIDIPIGPSARCAPSLLNDRITQIELELVNRHHAEMKELYRSARQGE